MARPVKKAAAVVEKLARSVGGQLVCDVQLDKENIDLVAVLPTGIFIIEVKNWSGRVSLKGDVMFHGGRHPRRVHAQVERQRRKLIEQLDLGYDVHGVIVFTPNDTLRITGHRSPGSTPIVMLAGLADHLVGPKNQRRPTILKPYEVAGLATTICCGRKLVITPTDPLVERQRHDVAQRGQVGVVAVGGHEVIDHHRVSATGRSVHKQQR